MASNMAYKVMAVRDGFASYVFTALLIAIFPSICYAGTWVAFGPVTYTRASGSPVTVTNTFTLLNPATTYTLKAFNGGLQNNATELVSSSVVTLNGVQVIGPNNFNQNVSEVIVPISPQSSNSISVQLRGQPGGVLIIEVIGVDNDPPHISGATSTPPNSSGWNNSDVTVSFACSDTTSGVAVCPAPVTVSSEGANQTITGIATDLAGNTATSSVVVNIDKTPPVITSTITPPPDAGGWNSGPVTVTFNCSDALSGVAICPAPVSVVSQGPNQTVTGIATDLAGNIRNVSTVVNISTAYFTIVSYQGKCLDYGAPWQGTGPTVFLNDCSQAHSIRVEEIDSQHDVILHAGNQVIGIHNPSIALISTTDPTAPQYALELQDLATLPTQPRTNQIFSLDGDSILLTANRGLVHRSRMRAAQMERRSWSHATLPMRSFGTSMRWTAPARTPRRALCMLPT